LLGPTINWLNAAQNFHARNRIKQPSSQPPFGWNRCGRRSGARFSSPRKSPKDCRNIVVNFDSW
jgi:hypothetical protein